MTKPCFWIIGGGLLQVPLIDEAKALGYDIIVSDGSENCVCKPLSTHFFHIDIFDYNAHIECAEKLVKKGIIIEGVLAAGIDAPETMAKVAEHLNLPTVSSEIAHLVNNKDKFREKMKELGVPVPRFAIINSQNADQIDDILIDIKYPLIVKNTSSSGSRGTKLFFTPDNYGVKDMVSEAISVSRSGNALIESLWEGTEHTVETIFDSSRKFHRGFITDRQFDNADGFALETGLVHPTTLSKDIQDDMYTLAEDLAKKLGITIGAAKYDMIQTKEGPRIIEMTVRLSGGFDCQYLVPAATGKNLMKAAILTATGKLFDDYLLKDTKNKVALSESLWPRPGKLTAINGLDIAKKMPGFEKIFFRYKVGDTVAPYIDCTKRVCFIIVSGDSLEEATANMTAIKNTIECVTEQ
ncbi:hypothetical protein DID80_01150 [Candidatus Marinamargulisbacteria bacterium SCGC AAA071-K20]|nr:hypothetical protein DID80_01150 [Candidatus Marinamargulisbacteria bacterium SCGC AAA071-K20]